MPITDITRACRFSAQQMYDLVADIDRYHEFLPYCTASYVHNSITRADGKMQLQAELQIAYKLLCENYMSDVLLDPVNKTIQASQSTHAAHVAHAAHGVHDDDGGGDNNNNDDNNTENPKGFPGLLGQAQKYYKKPFRQLDNQWRFEDITKTGQHDNRDGGITPSDTGEPVGSLIYFHLEFELQSPMLRRLLQPIMTRAVGKFVEAFEIRAQHIYAHKQEA